MMFRLCSFLYRVCEWNNYVCILSMLNAQCMDMDIHSVQKGSLPTVLTTTFASDLQTEISEGVESDTSKCHFQAGALCSNCAVCFSFSIYTQKVQLQSHMYVSDAIAVQRTFPHSQLPRSLFVYFAKYGTHGALLTALDNLLIMGSCVVDVNFCNSNVFGTLFFLSMNTKEKKRKEKSVHNPATCYGVGIYLMRYQFQCSVHSCAFIHSCCQEKLIFTHFKEKMTAFI